MNYRHPQWFQQKFFGCGFGTPAFQAFFKESQAFQGLLKPIGGNRPHFQPMQDAEASWEEMIQQFSNRFLKVLPKGTTPLSAHSG